jgi:hypothetical protein
VNSRAQVSSQPGQGRDRSAVGQVGTRVSFAHEGGDLERRAQPVLQAEGCGGEESTGPRTPTLGVCCLEPALQRLSRPPPLQAEEKLRLELLRRQKARTPRRSCAALQRLSRPPPLQAEEKLRLQKQKARTPRRSCAALSVLCVDWSAAVCRSRSTAGQPLESTETA